MSYEVAARNKAMWHYPKIMGFNPSERWGHTACYSNGFIYVYGGCCGGLHFSDVLVLNLQTMSWKKLMTVGQGPGTRDSHTSVFVEQKMIIFGGSNGTKKVNDIHVLDLESREWSHPHCKGIAPSPRESHTATLFGTDKLVIFGGSGEGAANYMNDLHVLDLKKMSWNSPQVRGDVPVPRDSHSAVAIENKLIVYGGDCGVCFEGDVYILYLDTMTWSRLAVHGSSPGVRAGHVAVSFDTKVYVIGGVGNKRYYNDVWVLDTRTCLWTRLEIHGQQPQGRFSHTAIAMDTEIAIYGGCGEDEQPLNDLLILQLGAAYPKYSISMFEDKEFTKEARKATMISANIEMVTKEDNESEAKLAFQLSSDTLHPKRRRMSNTMIHEIESDPEEHSLSMSQQSSPSHSDQTPVKKVACFAKAAQLFPLVNQHSPVSTNSQFGLRNISDRASEDIYFLGENFNQKKPERICQGRSITHDSKDKIPMETGQLQIAIGTDVHGKVDEVFDSGYLMTATVDGRVFRGVLFSPGPPVSSRNVTIGQNHPSPTSHIMQQSSPRSRLKPNFFGHYQQSATIQTSESDQGFQQGYGNKHNSAVENSSLLGQNARNELPGVVLTLGGPRSNDGL